MCGTGGSKNRADKHRTKIIRGGWFLASFLNLRVWVCVQGSYRFVFCSSRAVLLWLVLSTHYFLPWNCCSWDFFCLCTSIWKDCFCSLIASTPQPKYRTEALWHSWGLHKDRTKVLVCRRLAWLNDHICFQGLSFNASIKSYFVLTITSWSKTIHRWKELVLLTEHSRHYTYQCILGMSWLSLLHARIFLNG